MDEATSALDNSTEKEVMAAIEGLSHQLTVILIAHRLSTLEKCDRIFQLDQGQVCQEGDRMVIRQLTRRLGELSEQRLGQIRQLSVPQLEALAESLLDFRDISDLEAWLKDAEKSNDLKPQVDIQNGNQLDV
ncbi:DUF4351 domain-containing protein [Cylindrospermopsis raciborskii]|uniref:DUF4351 domain-containing protein n=2 Tax=Cylindrospermopsis raciborskii TaxID=77022 RepID=UPI000B0DC51C|nr:DUF4351 domain-containing protein [Cylindrospermopsis raciborskii]